ncbi:MAG TPA: AAA family ATPase [Clostridia bacterium]|nr:AAA family ATPase [Clostridia bacterium]
MNAFPGAIIRTLSGCGSSAPVLLLDEVDKIPSASNKGDCGSIFLDILDSNRSAFVDYYLQVPVDLSEVFFICTANAEEGIPKPLLDRMEIIRLQGYTDAEKFQIAKRHIIPQMLYESGLDKLDYGFSDDSIGVLVDACTANKGVRELERLVVSVCRRAALLFLENEMESTIITESFITEQNILKKFCPVKERRIGFYYE